jgi:hypothetical protein
MTPMPSEATQHALAILRDGSQYQWYVVPLLAIALYVYAVEIERRNWDLVFAGLALWGMDWLNEIVNGLVLHVTGYAPLWGAPARTAYLFLVGLNVEICFMFAIAGIVVGKLLPANRTATILGMPNRWVIAIAASLFCVLVELWLNAIGALTWDYWWWNARHPWLIVVFGYLTFFVVAFRVHDMPSVRRKAATVGTLLAIDAASLALFAGWLRWI